MGGFQIIFVLYFHFFVLFFISSNMNSTNHDLIGIPTRNAIKSRVLTSWSFLPKTPKMLTPYKSSSETAFSQIIFILAPGIACDRLGSLGIAWDSMVGWGWDGIVVVIIISLRCGDGMGY